ncbi:unnamed protein product [Anisakis simplex]|uniref:SAP30_Sin3_bdg domain-containing protein n=1 Tax=Anisakis simplex TaxID=6269 RepID=A0A0M3K2B9_ANISI|nr:unnamed protein product [Anisakis simplex]
MEGLLCLLLYQYQSDNRNMSNNYRDEETNSDGHFANGRDEECFSSRELKSDANGDKCNERLKCCIAEYKSDVELYECCDRHASPIWLSDKLRRICTLKRFPFVYNTARRHYYVCLYHRRLIVNEPALDTRNDSLKNRDLSVYEQLSAFDEDELIEIDDDPINKQSLRKMSDASSTVDDASDESVQIKYRKCSIGKEVNDESMEMPVTEDTDKATGGMISSQEDRVMVISGDNGDDVVELSTANENNTSKCDDNLQSSSSANTVHIPFNALSAASLRRYKKHFKLSHRSGASTKQQLLDGVAEHFSTLQVPITETAACLLYMIRINNNKLDTAVSNQSSSLSPRNDTLIHSIHHFPETPIRF